MIPVVEVVRLAGRAAHRAELPGRHVARAGQGRHHPGLHPPRGPGRRGLALGHAHLRGGPGDDRRRASASRPAWASAATRSSGRSSSTSWQLFAADPETEALVLIGEIGGAAEEEAAAWAAEHMADVPKVAFIAGRTAPEGKRMGHAGRDHLGRPGHRGVQGHGARGRGLPRRGLPHRAAGPAARGRLPGLTCASTTSGTCSATTAGRPGRILAVLDGVPDETWGATGVVGDRGLGAILVHQLGAHQRWRLGPQAATTRRPERARPEREPLPSPAAARRGLGGRVGGAWTSWLDTPRRRRGWHATDEGVPVWQMLAHVVNHGTQHRSEAAALLTADRAVAGRPGHDLLRRGDRAGSRVSDPLDWRDRHRGSRGGPTEGGSAPRRL